jgi:hypothetical protein
MGCHRSQFPKDLFMDRLLISFLILAMASPALAQSKPTAQGSPTTQRITPADGGASIANGTLSGLRTMTAVDNRSGSFLHNAEGSSVLAASYNGFTAQQIANWVFCNCVDPVSYDAVRGIGILTPGSKIDLVNGVAGYVMSQAPISGPYPTSVALFGMGIADTNGSSVWGLNTALTDNRGQVLSSGVNRNLYNEIDLNFTSPHSTGIGLQVAGASLAQPAAAIGFGCSLLSQNGSAKWSSCYHSDDGASDTFLVVGTKAASGSNVAGQNFTMKYRNEGGKPETLSFAAQPTGGIFFANSEGSIPVITGTAIQLAAYTVSTLPTCNASRRYQVFAVNDANAPAYGAPLSGGGAAVAVALCDGTSWTAH